jgi:hypothetical protein
VGVKTAPTAIVAEACFRKSRRSIWSGVMVYSVFDSVLRYGREGEGYATLRALPFCSMPLAHAPN